MVWVSKGGQWYITACTSKRAGGTNEAASGLGDAGIQRERVGIDNPAMDNANPELGPRLKGKPYRPEKVKEGLRLRLQKAKDSKPKS